MSSVVNVFVGILRNYREQLVQKNTFRQMLYISLKNALGWGLPMKQQPYFPPEKDKHSHKGGIFCHKKIFLSVNLLQLLTLGNIMLFSL